MSDRVVAVTESDSDTDSTTDDAEAPDDIMTSPTDSMTGQTATSRVSVERSTDVHVGSRLNYNAPVTIHQYVTTPASSPRDYGQLALSAPFQGIDEDDLSESTTERDTIDDVALSIDENEPSTPNSSRLRLTIVVVIFVLMTLINITPNHPASQPIMTQHNESEVLNIKQSPSYFFNRTLLGGYRIYNRSEWDAFPPQRSLPFSQPATFVVISQTNSKQCYNRQECSDILKTLQGNYPDYIIHSFMVDRNGSVYEGRGWDEASQMKQTVLIDSTVHNSNLFIAYIGFKDGESSLSQEQIGATHQLLELGVELGKLSVDYKIVLLGQLTNNLQLPQKQVWREVMTWEHYFDKNKTWNIHSSLVVRRKWQDESLLLSVEAL